MWCGVVWCSYTILHAVLVWFLQINEHLYCHACHLIFDRNSQSDGMQSSETWCINSSHVITIRRIYIFSVLYIL